MRKLGGYSVNLDRNSESTLSNPRRLPTVRMYLKMELASKVRNGKVIRRRYWVRGGTGWRVVVMWEKWLLYIKRAAVYSHSKTLRPAGWTTPHNSDWRLCQICQICNTGGREYLTLFEPLWTWRRVGPNIMAPHWHLTKSNMAIGTISEAAEAISVIEIS